MSIPPPVEGPSFGLLAMRMKQLREAQGLSHEALAERSGLGRRSVIALERRERDGTFESWYRVALGLGVTMSELVKVLDQ